MSTKFLKNVKCNCEACNGTGIKYDSFSDVAILCMECLGSGYKLEPLILEDDNRYYKNDHFVLVEKELFFSKNVVPSVKFVTLANPYQSDESCAEMVSYEDFLAGDLPKLSTLDGCPLDYLDYYGCSYCDDLCPHNCQKNGIYNYVDECPFRILTDDCWYSINNSVISTIRKRV